MSHHHQLLGIPINAGKETIKRAFREKAKKYHPDRNHSLSAKDNFIHIHQSYKYLMDNHGKPNAFKQRYKSQATTSREEQARKAQERAAKLAKMRYEQFRKEEEAFRNSSFAWFYKLIYFITYILLLMVAVIIGTIPFFAGINEGWFSFFILAPIFFFGTFAMIQKATKWKKEVNQVFAEE